MAVKLHVDLETLQLIQAPGLSNPVSALRFKRGDGANLEVVFLSNGTPVILGSNAQVAIQFGAKERGKYHADYLIHADEWTMPAIGAEPPTYSCVVDFNNASLDALLGVGTTDELAEATLMGEITWSVGSGAPVSTRTFLVVVENDVIRGEAAPPPPPPPPAGLLDGILGFWPMNETDASQFHADSTANNNTLVADGFSTAVAGRLGNAVALEYGCSDAYHKFNLSGGFFVSCWLQRAYATPNSGAATQWYHGNGGFIIGAESQGPDGDNWSFVVSGGEWMFGPVCTGNWTHVVGSYDPAGNTELWVDGVLVASQPSVPMTDSSSATFKIGSLDYGYEFNYAGKIDALGLWGRPATPGDIAALYNSGTGIELP